MKKVTNDFKLFLGELMGKKAAEEEEIEDISLDEMPMEFTSDMVEEERLESGHIDIAPEPIKAGEEETCHTVFMDPKSFEDCSKIANYVKNDKMVTLNLENLDAKTAQRILDFIGGATAIKEASFHKISGKVYTSIPKDIKVYREV